MTIVQISDPHIAVPGQSVFGRIDTAARLARCVDSILLLQPRPELVVASGDLVNTGAAQEYRRLRDILAALPMPVYLMPGNHDEHSALRAEFTDHAYLPRVGTLHYAVETDVAQLLMLDTVVPGEDGGALDAEQMKWLDLMLAAARDRHVLIFMHHPPIMTGIPYMDEIALAADDAAAFGALVDRHSRIERISCGHVHRTVAARWNGTTVGVCPSTAFQYGLGLCEECAPVPTAEFPGYQVHCWNGRQLVTHTVQVPDPA